MLLPGLPTVRRLTVPTHENSFLCTGIQREIQQHDFSTFVDEPGNVQPGRPACKKRLNTVGQFLNHLMRSGCL